MDCHIGVDSWVTELSYDLQLSETAVLSTVFEGTQYYGVALHQATVLDSYM